ncbi:MAG TPA: carboxypeptidase-like regulatory domain-containing protein [Pyrinomonadaceae bacterium]|nr:carboxypeptidase-like regulatory domain-containing protein [Pyrinomonadaceae bacterium]
MKRVSFFLALAVCTVLFLAASATSAFAQGDTGSVTGVVTDPQGGTVPGADVTLTSIATKSSQTATTNDSGRFHFASISVGLYDIVISKSGFKIHKAAAQKVSVGSQLTVDVALEVGDLSQTVVVTSQAGSELQTANATIGNTIDLKNLEILPNLGRDATTLMALQPGVNPNGGHVAGAYMDQSTFTIDGGNNTDDMAGNTIGYIQNFTGTAGAQTNQMASGVVATPIESVEEFKVSTFGQTADFNSSSGASVQMVTKRGTTQWHGSGYGYYFATNIMGANSWANNHTTFTKGLAPDRRACAAGTTYQKGDNNCVMPYTPIIPNHRDRFGFTLGGPMTPKILGGKTYFFINYEGFRYPNATTIERSYPTPALRAGVIQVANGSSPVTYQGVTYAAGAFIPYNLNPFPVTTQVGNGTTVPYTTVTLAPATCPGGVCDPRGIGLNPIVKQIWTKFLPLPNDPLAGDGYNTQGYLGTIRLPLVSNNYVGRIDHDFGSKHRFFTSFRAFKLLNTTSNQVDVGGLLGGTFGQYQASAPRPQLGEIWVIGLTSTLSPTLTNDLRLSYLYNWWQWSTAGGPPQIPGLGGAVEIAPGNAQTAESTGALIPYNVNSQSIRQRVWDGQDKMIRDDLTWVKGNHLVQFGGQYQHNYNFHIRSDNGVGVNNQITYQIGRNAIDWSSATGGLPWIPTAVPAAQRNAYANLASEVLGMVGLPQVAYARAGADLSLQPVGSSAFDQSTIKFYNLYISDTWRVKPSLTINYGLGYAYETPPVEKNGKQVALVYQDGTIVDTVSYLAKRKAAALAGQVYNPVLGFETTGNLKKKYPYNPFRTGFSPRVSVAWNPSYKSGLMGTLFGDGKTVIRGGYGRIYGRLNGVNLVLVPLLGVGLLQSVSCANNLMPAAPGLPGTCSSSLVNPTNVFRIGTDGQVAPLPAASATLAQPFFTGGLNPVAQDATVLDLNYKPEKTDNVNFTIQRQLSKKVQIEVGYMGRRIRNVFQELNLDAVPYMTTLGGQAFSDAYAKTYFALNGGTAAASVPVQPFFETALGGPNSVYCKPFSSCTVAVATNQGANILNTAVSNVWQALNAANGWILGRTMISQSLNGGAGQATTLNETTSTGFSNYNAMFITLNMRDWHGLSGITNFTWGRALGTAEIGQYNSSNTTLDAWNNKGDYGLQLFDVKALFNSGLAYQPTSLFGWGDFRSKKGIVGHLVKGWTIAPFFTFQSGPGAFVGFSGTQSFGSVTPPGGDTVASEGALLAGPFTGGNSLHRGVLGSNGVGTNNVGGLNMFADPESIIKQFRRCVLGADTSCGGYYNLRAPKIWNVDMSLSKDFKFGERVSLRASVQFTNVFNHFAPGSPALTVTTPSTFGRITGQATSPRQTEFGMRLSF